MGTTAGDDHPVPGLNSFTAEDIFHSLGRGVLTVDPECRIVSFNMHAHTLLDLDAIRDRGQLLPDSLKEIHLRLQACLSTGTNSSAILTIGGRFLFLEFPLSGAKG
jgi:hypothetical protein